MKKSYLTVTFIFILCFMLTDPVHGMEGVKNGLLLWYERVLPALLPFTIISYILVESDNLRFFSRILYPALKKVIPVSPNGVYPLIAGFLFGFPLGSNIVAQLFSSKKISGKEAAILLSMCNNISPIFITGYIVHQTLKDDALMIPALVCIYLPPLLIGSFRLRKLPKKTFSKKNEAPRSQITFKIIDAGIMNGFETLLKLCGYIVLFSILCEPLKRLSLLFPKCCLFINGILEITNGISYLGSCHLNKPLMFLLCTTFTAFGGLCGLAQTNAMISDTTLSIRRYLVDKSIYSFATLLVSLLFVTFAL